jgi:hypothetical protein
MPIPPSNIDSSDAVKNSFWFPTQCEGIGFPTYGNGVVVGSSESIVCA